MKLRDIRKPLQCKYDSLYTEALELQSMGILQRDENGFWSLVHKIVEADHGRSYQDDKGDISSTSASSTAPDSPHTPQGPKEIFIQRLENIGVQPKGAIPSIAETFFAGDIDDMKWMHHVLSWVAVGFVTPPQCNLIMNWWAVTRGIRYDSTDFFKRDA